MRAVVVARTHMGQNMCVGAVAERGGELLRLIPRKEAEVRGWKSFEAGVGELIEMQGSRSSELDPPHVEDFLIDRWRRTGYRVKDLVAWIANVCEVWEGGPERLFGGCLRSTGSGSRYIERDGATPAHSVGFWTLPWPLRHQEQMDIGRIRHTFRAAGTDIFRVSYVGTEEPPDMLPRGRLVRVSLSRWWKRSNESKPRCWLQLSGWY